MKILAGIGIALSVLANVVGVLGFFGFGPLRILEFASDRRAKSVEIAWPSGREPIPRCIEVRGTSTPLPSGEALWASVYTESATENQNVYYLGSRAEYDRNRVRLWSARWPVFSDEL
jgi:hypothetical protein